MLPYYFLIITPIIFSFVNLKGFDKKKNNQRIIVFFFLILIVLLSLRSNTVGRDLKGYKMIFDDDIRQGWEGLSGLLSEPAWFILNNLIGFFTTDFQWLLIICALASVIPIMHLYKKEIEIPALTITLYVTMSTFIMLFSGLRQSISIACGIIALGFVQKRKFLPYLLLVILAFLFHKSSFILLFMYPLYHVRITKKWLWFVIPAMALIFIFNEQIFSLLLLMMSDLYEGDVSNTGAYTILILFAVFCVFSFVIPDEDKLDNTTIGMRNFLLLATALQMFAPLHTLSMRFGYYYMIFIPILIPKIIKASRIKWKQVAMLSEYVMIVFFIVYFFISAPATNSLRTFPYRFFWESII